MNAPMSRRRFAGIALAMPFAAAPGIRAATAQTPIGTEVVAHATLADTRHLFDAEYGVGTETDGYVVYDFSAGAQAAYWVRFDRNGFAESVEIDFTALPGGGLEPAEENIGVSRFLPTDSAAYMRGDDLGFNSGEKSSFYLRGLHSDAAASITGRTGNIVVVDQTGPWLDGMQGPPPIHRTNVAMETAEVNPIVVTATAPGPHSTTEEWEAAYGDTSMAQRLAFVHNPPIPGSWNFGQGEVDIKFDEPIGCVDAAELIGSMVGLANGQTIPEAPTSTHWLAPTPGGPTGIRIHSWKPSRWHETHAIQMIDGGEENGSVSRIMMADSLV